ncbi:MAG: DUF2135 domain-containing protein [Vicinamibacteria bacterium]|nr:DUF2135 domain-containing protein [Vicinamibacteria bacterium]
MMQLAMLGVLLASAFSQQIPATTSRPPALLVRIAEEGPSQPLSIEKMEVQVSATAFLAETTTTLTFRNDNTRALEGDLVFPLPEGSTLSGYALDVDGVVVEQQKARVVFEAEVRKGVDPGLAEWVKGNNFRTRVWPIPARGTRTVRVRYISALAARAVGDAMETTYVLPMVRQRIAGFSLRIEVAKTLAAPEIRSGRLANFNFSRWDERYVAETHLEQFEAGEDLIVALPAVPRRSVMVERGFDGGAYFILNDSSDVVPEARTPSPKRVGLYWDASLSRESADRRAETRAIESWLRRIGDVELDVVVFRNVAEPRRAFSIRGGNTAALSTFLEAAPRDGGTDLGSLVFDSGHDYEVLVTDGLDTLTDRLPESKRPLYILNGDARANHAVLRHLARISGGVYFNLQTATDDEAARGIGSGGSLPFLDYDESQVADVSSLALAGSSNGGRVAVTGRLLVPEAAITIRYGSGPSSRSRRFVIRREGASEGRLIPTFWAQQRVTELSVFADRNRAQLLALGRSFGIVTPGASLLVFETLAQYLASHIEPPASRAEMRAAYLAQVASDDEEAASEKRRKAKSVLEMWKTRVAWWERSFPHSPDFRFKDQRKSRGDAGGVEGGVAGGVAGGVVRLPMVPAEPRPGASIPGANETITVEAAAPVPYTSSASVGRMSRSTASDADGPAIVLKAWNPDTPYLRAITQAGRGKAYAEFLTQRVTHGESPAFFLDCADYFLKAGDRALAIRVLTDIAELRLEEPQLLRVVAHRLQQIEEFDLALVLFESVLRLRPEEPQSLRDVAGVLTERADLRPRPLAANRASALSDYERALQLLQRVIMGTWDSRFDEIQVFAIEESNRILAKVQRDAGPGAIKNVMDPRLRLNFETDLRIVLTWDTDDTDMDLWVVEPSGEQAMYSNNLTTIGGMVSDDFTDGYGPEEYLIREGMPGVYRIKADYFGSRAQTLTGPTTLQATIFTDFGRPTEKRRSITIRLGQAKENLDIGEVQLGLRAAKAPPPPR